MPDTPNVVTARSEMRAEVARGLSREQKELSPKYFYDQRGSELFEEITKLDEYYPTRTEAALLRSAGAPWLRMARAAALVELGAGNAEKTRILLDAMADRSVYMPVDISADFLRDAAIELRREYPRLRVQPCVSDITHALRMPDDLPAPAVFAFLGSTIGNFENDAAVHLLRNVRDAMRPTDRFLMGVDLKKDPGILEAAYNDAEGITAEFNLNILRVLNHKLGSDFEVNRFAHRAFYNGALGRIEMHLVSLGAQVVHIPGVHDVEFADGETIRTEVSTKYDEVTVRGLMGAASLELETWQTDNCGWYALLTARARD